MILGAHAHPGEIRAPVSSRHPDLELVIMMTPSTAPLGLLQPGYTIIDITPNTTSAVWRFLQLHEYILYEYQDFITLDVQKEFSVNLANATSIRAFTQSISEDKS